MTPRLAIFARLGYVGIHLGVETGFARIDMSKAP